MFYVYILESIRFPKKSYVGFSANLKQRLQAHNKGRSKYTSKYRPWAIRTYVAFSDEQKAKQFELYLKSGSGTAFRRKRL